MIKYQAICSVCKRVYPVLITDPSKTPMCCHQKMDAVAQDVDEYVEKTVIELGFYHTS